MSQDKRRAADEGRDRDKARTLLGNVERRQKDIRVLIDSRSPDVSPKETAAFRVVEEKIADAKTNIDTSDAVFHVMAAASAQSMFEHEWSTTGFVVRVGGRKGSRLSDEDRSERHAAWASYARLLLALEPRPLARGVKSEIAKKVANHSGGKFHTVRKRLQEMGVFDE
jgi:hypothetical protein